MKHNDYILIPKAGQTVMFIDTETTGLPIDKNVPYTNGVNWPRLVQISWILTNADGEMMFSYDFIIRPEHFSIPYESTRVHGITNTRARADGHKLTKVLKIFLNYLNQADIIVGHNVDFDINVIAAELYRKGLSTDIVTKPRVCTMKLGTNYCMIEGRYGYKYPKLTELYYALFQEHFYGAHDAMADVTATMHCYFGLIEVFTSQSPMSSQSLHLYRVDMLTDMMCPVDVDVWAYSPSEAENIAISMLEGDEIECLGNICVASEVTLLQ